MRLVTRAAPVVVVFVAAVSSEALAQQPGYGPPPGQGQPGYGPPPGQGQPGYGPPPGQGQPGYGPPVYGGRPYAYTQPADDDAADAMGRLWIGFNVNGGYGTAGDLTGPAGGATFRLGWVFTRQIGVYGNLTFLGWAGSNDKLDSSVSIGAISGILTSPSFAFTPVDLFEISAGPSLDYLTGGGVDATVNGQTLSASGFSSAYFGINTRAALHFGGRNEQSRRRRGFTLGFDVHPTFAEGETVVLYQLGLGADWF